MRNLVWYSGTLLFGLMAVQAAMRNPFSILVGVYAFTAAICFIYGLTNQSRADRTREDPSEPGP